jgi:hypothetical protein
MTGDLFALLLQDAAHLLKPLRITQIAPVSATMPASDRVPPTHPHSMPVLVLSDLNGLFSATSERNASQDNSMRRKDTHITHKLLFYAAHILSTPSVILDAVANEMRARAGGYRSQEKRRGSEGPLAGEGVGRRGELVVEMT